MYTLAIIIMQFWNQSEFYI